MRAGDARHAGIVRRQSPIVSRSQETTTPACVVNGVKLRSHRLFLSRRWAAVACLLALGACAADSFTAQRAETTLRGMSATDLMACAGVPATTRQSGYLTFWTYEHDAPSSNGVNLTFPIIGGGVSLSGGGWCQAIFRLKSGRVADLRYSGATGSSLLPDENCAPLVRSCVVYARQQRKEAARKD